ncbi:MAG: GNAT family N-acetyltransferase [Pseudonocardiales bacterium]|nr:GNAT family N-acetyltransferase [Pseudonocardiales bacterium]MBV9032484.1 GNAT family N-acetyltransferase [Pseudonocardiales bacterium]
MPTGSLSGLSLEPVEPSDEQAIRQWYELRCAVVRADWPDYPPPCRVDELGCFQHPWPGEVETAWVARVAGSVVGGCLLTLPMLDNPHNARGTILVAPEHRRRGIGRTLLAHLRAEAIRQGRVRLVSWVEQPLDPAAPDPAGRFAAASAAVPALVETRRWLDIGSVDPAVLARLDAQARVKSRDYSLVQWVGGTPQRWLDDIAYLTGRMSTDAPLDDLRWDAEFYDAARMRACEASRLARGQHLVTTAAVERTGRLVAFTRIVGFATSRWFAGQEDTIVAPEHRGHRLGTLVKVANLGLARAQRPELRVIDTCNADSNQHMVRINEAMGFRPHHRTAEWQLDL